MKKKVKEEAGILSESEARGVKPAGIMWRRNAVFELLHGVEREGGMQTDHYFTSSFLAPNPFNTP